VARVERNTFPLLEGSQVQLPPRLSSLFGERARARIGRSPISPVLRFDEVFASGNSAADRETTVKNACDLATKVEVKVEVWFNEFGTSIDRSIELLKDSEQKLETVVEKGGDSPDLRYCRAQTLIRFADGYRALGNTEQSLDRAKEASALLERLVQSRPSELAWKHELVKAYRKVGDGLDEQGSLTDALDWYGRSLDIGLGLTGVAAVKPKIAEWQHDLSIAYNKIGGVLTSGIRPGHLAVIETASLSDNASLRRTQRTHCGSAIWHRPTTGSAMFSDLRETPSTRWITTASRSRLLNHSRPTKKEVPTGNVIWRWFTTRSAIWSALAEI